MKKITLSITAIILLALCVSNNANAQMSFGLTGGVGIPMGDMADKAKGDLGTGFGGTLQGRYHINDNMAIGLNIGYFSFAPKDLPSGVTGSGTVMPISAAFDYYFMTDGFKPYVGIELGYMNSTYKASGSGMDISASNGGIMFAPVIGAAYGVNDNLDILFNLKYMYGGTSGTVNTTVGGTTVPVDIATTTYIGINIGIQYKLGK